MEEAQTIENAVPGFYGATGRRKEAVCRVDLKPGKGKVIINGRPKEKYLFRETLVTLILAPLTKVELNGKVDITAHVRGGGLTGQAGAIRLAIARALIKFDPELRPVLKKAGYLEVDARKVERKKYGRPKARKRFQFSKR